DGAGAGVEDRAGVAAGVRPVVPDDLGLAPGLAAVGAALQEQIDVAGIAAAVLATLAEGEQRPLSRGEQGRDAVRVVAILARDEDGHLLQFGGARGDRGGQNEEGGGREATSRDHVFLRYRPGTAGEAPRCRRVIL